MQGRRNKFKPDFKGKAVLEALKSDKSTAELAQIFGVHPSQISKITLAFRSDENTRRFYLRVASLENLRPNILHVASKAEPLRTH